MRSAYSLINYLDIKMQNEMRDAFEEIKPFDDAKKMYDMYKDLIRALEKYQGEPKRFKLYVSELIKGSDADINMKTALTDFYSEMCPVEYDNLYSEVPRTLKEALSGLERAVFGTFDNLAVDVGRLADSINVNDIVYAPYGGGYYASTDGNIGYAMSTTADNATELRGHARVWNEDYGLRPQMINYSLGEAVNGH